MFLRALAATASLLLISCGSTQLSMPGMNPYRMEIQQGNFVSQEMVSQLKLGMSKDQVRFVLGTPLIVDSFHADRWDYVFRRQRANSREMEQRKITVIFADGKLKRIDGDIIPESGAGTAAVKTPETKPGAQQPPASTGAAASKPAAPTSAEAAKPAQAADAGKPAAAPVPPADGKPQEKSWWEQLKDKLKL